MINDRKGFTLIELLVVIAIIAILAAILFPVFISAKLKAGQTRCVANLKQIGMAADLYMNDSSGRFPPWIAIDPKTGRQVGAWYFLLQRYSKTKLLSKCPALEMKGGTVSYWSNGYLNNWDERPSPMDSSVRYRSWTVFLQDGPCSDTGKVSGVWMDAQHNWWGPPRSWHDDKDTYEAEHRHSDRANVLFCDWHVKSVKPEEFDTRITGTASTNTLVTLKIVVPPYGKWAEKADGSHPWYRHD